MMIPIGRLALARVLLEETLPRVAQAIKSDVDDSDEDSKHAAVVATRCADVLVRGAGDAFGRRARKRRSPRSWSRPR